MRIDPVGPRQAPIDYFDYYSGPEAVSPQSNHTTVVVHARPFQHDTMSVAEQRVTYLDLNSPDSKVQPFGMEGMRINQKDFMAYTKHIESQRYQINPLADFPGLLQKQYS
jgi:hypothetical protein